MELRTSSSRFGVHSCCCLSLLLYICLLLENLQFYVFVLGHTDTKLNATGLKQAELLANSFKSHPSVPVYSSSLSRAKDTALAICNVLCQDEKQLFPSDILIVDDRIREMHLGIFQGLTANEARKAHPSHWQGYASSDSYIIPNGESMDMFRNRVLDFFNDICIRHALDEYVIVVTHGGVIDCLRREFTVNSSQFETRCSNASISLFQVNGLPEEPKHVSLIDVG